MELPNSTKNYLTIQKSIVPERGDNKVDISLAVIIIGAGGTFIMDIWALLLKRVFKVQGLNYAMVGRWIGHFPRGKLMHKNITTSKPIVGEAIIGIIAHYAIGVVFAAGLVFSIGVSWVDNPSIVPAIATGLITLSFLLFLMQPCFGMGIAASNSPQPHNVQMKSFIAHLIYGVGLYISAFIVSNVI